MYRERERCITLVDAYVYIYICIWLERDTYIYIYVYMYMCIYIYIYTYVYIYIYIFSHLCMYLMIRLYKGPCRGVRQEGGRQEEPSSNDVYNDITCMCE